MNNIKLYELVAIYMSLFKKQEVSQEELAEWAVFMNGYFKSNDIPLNVLNLDDNNLEDFRKRNFVSQIFKIESTKKFRGRKHYTFKIEEGSDISEVDEILELEGCIDLYLNSIGQDMKNQYLIKNIKEKQ